MKIAILILIHKFSTQQQLLIKHLAKNFEIFVHIDKKSDISLKDLNFPNVYAYKKYKVFWGSYNQILATLFLFKMAYNHGINRYILISGEDIPLKSNTEISQFFENNRNNYLSIASLPYSDWTATNGGLDRVDYFWLNSYERVYIKSRIMRKLINLSTRLNDAFINFCKHRKLKRKLSNQIQLFGGANWMDLTDDCVSQIMQYLDKNKFFLKKFKFTRCADEIFFQTIIKNFVSGICIEEKSLRYVDWESGPEYPRILRLEDYDKIMKSGCIFARKINIDVDSDIINKLYNKINN